MQPFILKNSSQNVLLFVIFVIFSISSFAQKTPLFSTDPARPQFEISVNGRLFPINSNRRIPKMSRIQIRIIPDSAYQAENNDTLMYRIVSIDVFAQLGLGRPVKVRTINTDNRDATKPIMFTFGTKVRQARPYTRVFVQVNQIYWINEFGEKILEKRFLPQEKTFSFVTR